MTITLRRLGITGKKEIHTILSVDVTVTRGIYQIEVLIGSKISHAKELITTNIPEAHTTVRCHFQCTKKIQSQIQRYELI